MKVGWKKTQMKYKGVESGQEVKEEGKKGSMDQEV